MTTYLIRGAFSFGVLANFFKCLVLLYFFLSLAAISRYRFPFLLPLFGSHMLHFHFPVYHYSILYYSQQHDINVYI